MNKYFYATTLLCCFFLMNSAFADIYIKIKNTDKSQTFTSSKPHANIEDLAIKPCTFYTEEALKADYSVQMSCTKDPDNTLFTHHLSSRKGAPNGKAQVFLNFEERPGMECMTEMIPLIDGVNVVSLLYPRDFKCTKLFS